ncbi:MAG: twin-arginine translocase TatA/TatE family subunit [Peptococcaceae bacterium]|nr:twin-arginine translocase TatA/TatE family subunit [Peptococcaceae bacterium]
MGLSFGEILLILVVAFLVLGPDKLPDAGRTLGKTVNSFKKALKDTNLDLKDEVEAIKKETGVAEITNLSAKAKEKETQFKNELLDLKKDLNFSDQKTSEKK